jgi:hypothetical protein
MVRESKDLTKNGGGLVWRLGVSNYFLIGGDPNKSALR